MVYGFGMKPGSPTSSGTYAGDGTNGRTIAHALGVIPKAVFIYDDAGPQFYFHTNNAGTTYHLDVTSNAKVAGLGPDDANNFYVGNGAIAGANLNAHTYYWAAFG